MTVSELAKLRVTDLHTGFVFVNVDVFMCHARSSSVPCLWQLATSTSSYFSPLDEQSLSESTFYQLPPADISLKTLSRCDSLALDNCTQTSPYFTKDLYNNCKAFTDTVSFESSDFNYKNRFCLECIAGEGQNVTSDMVDNRHVNPRFSTLVTLTTSGLSLEMSQPPWQDAMAWNTAVCDINNTIHCHVNKCAAGFFPRANGKCNERYTLHLAMKMGDKTQITGAEHQDLANAIQCMVNKHLNFDMDPGLTLTRYELRKSGQKVVLFGVKLRFYDTGDDDHTKKLASFSNRIGIPMTQALFPYLEASRDVSGGHYFPLQKGFLSLQTPGSNYQYEQYSSEAPNDGDFLTHSLFCDSISIQQYSTLFCKYQGLMRTLVRKVKNDDCLKVFYGERNSKEHNNSSNSIGYSPTITFKNILEILAYLSLIHIVSYMCVLPGKM